MIVGIILCLIAVTLAFEECKRRLEEKCSEDMLVIVEKLFGELTVLGFLAMCIFFIHTSGLLVLVSKRIRLDEEELVGYVEIVHYTLFSIMVFFVAQVLVLLRFAAETEDAWLAMDKECRDESLAISNSEWDPAESERQALAGLQNSAWYTRFVPQLFDHQAEKIRDTEIFRELRHEFILDRGLEPPFPAAASEKRQLDFDFGRYLAIAQSGILAHIVEVGHEAWISFAAATILFYAFAAVVQENLVFLAWAWVAIGWLVYLFNVIFENHLIHLRSNFLPRRTVSLLYGEGSQEQRVDERDDGNLALLEEERTGDVLPPWCDIDPGRYVENQRWWITQKLVGGKPNRHQSLFWMDQNGPHLYFFILQVNILFTGVYAGLLVLAFIPVIARHDSWVTSILYCLLALIPVLGITMNKKRLVATLTQICSIGSYRKLHIVDVVLRQQKTLNVVRSFIVIFKMLGLKAKDQTEDNNTVKRTSSGNSLLSESERVQVYKSFDAFDADGSGSISRDELKELLIRMGISESPETVERIISALDENSDGSISREEFLSWYSNFVSERLSVEDLAHEIFDTFDDNKNGQLTIGEFKEKFDVASNNAFTFDEIGAVVHEVDRDHSGTVSFEEFRDFLTRYMPEEMLVE